MQINDILTRLEAMRDAKTTAHNEKYGATQSFGVKLGDIRNLAKKAKIDRDTALALWATGNADAQLLACLIRDPGELSAADLDKMLPSTNFSRVADWFNSYLLKDRPDQDELRKKWIGTTDKWALRSAWSLTAGFIARRDVRIDPAATLEILEKEMPVAQPEVQWTMNFALAHIGIYYPELRQKAIKLGEQMGIYRDYPVSKGCTSPFAPIWITEISSRLNKIS